MSKKGTEMRNKELKTGRHLWKRQTWKKNNYGRLDCKTEIDQKDRQKRDNGKNKTTISNQRKSSSDSIRSDQSLI